MEEGRAMSTPAEMRAMFLSVVRLGTREPIGPDERIGLYRDEHDPAVMHGIWFHDERADVHVTTRLSFEDWPEPVGCRR